jgi:biotin transport system substrate-specific component
LRRKDREDIEMREKESASLLGRREVETVATRDLALPVARPVVLKAVLVLAGIGLLTASAWFSVPFYPVPMTMQTLAVLVLGGLLGPRLGAGAVAGYLALGLAGAPVFHGGIGGAAVLAGPTGGYLVGFLPAVFLMGLAGRRARIVGAGQTGWLREAAVLVAGALLAEATIYALGVPWLSLYTGGFRSAVAVGLVPFLLGDLLKMAVAVGAVRLGRRRLFFRGSPPF